MREDPTRISINFDPLVYRMQGITYHRNMVFDVPFISHIEGNLYQGGCETGMFLPNNIEHLISLYPWERYSREGNPQLLKTRAEFLLYDDAANPVSPMVEVIADLAYQCVEDGPTLIHCQAGLNRSSLVAGLVLTKQGYSPERAIALLREKRSSACLCNPVFEEYLLG